MNAVTDLGRSFITRLLSGDLLQQLSHCPLFILFLLTFHVLLSDLGHDELGDLNTTQDGRVRLMPLVHTEHRDGFLTVHRRFWYLISSRTMLAVLVAMENSCCSVTLERKPLNMKMLGAMTTETLLRVILFLA